MVQREVICSLARCTATRNCSLHAETRRASILLKTVNEEVIELGDVLVERTGERYVHEVPDLRQHPLRQLGVDEEVADIGTRHETVKVLVHLVEDRGVARLLLLRNRPLG